MRARLRYLWQHNRLALIAFAITLTLLVGFGVRTLSATVYWMNPAHQDQPLAGWMSPRYVARSYKLPPHVLGPALFLKKGAPPKRRSLDSIAADNGVSLAQLQSRIDAAAKDWRAAQETKE